MSDSAALSAILTLVAKLVKNLSAEELEKIASGTTQLLLAPKGSKIVFPLNLPELAADIRQIGSADDIVKLLDNDSRLTQAMLRKLAFELNIDLPSTAKSKPAIQLHVAQSAAAHWQRRHGRL